MLFFIIAAEGLFFALAFLLFGAALRFVAFLLVERFAVLFVFLAVLFVFLAFLFFAMFFLQVI